MFVMGCAAGKTITRYRRQHAIIILNEPETLPCKDTHNEHEWHDASPEMFCINDRVKRALKILK